MHATTAWAICMACSCTRGSFIQVINQVTPSSIPLARSNSWPHDYIIRFIQSINMICCNVTAHASLISKGNALLLLRLRRDSAACCPTGSCLQGGGARTLGLCPPTPNCISTAEELNDIGH